MKKKARNKKKTLTELTREKSLNLKKIYFEDEIREGELKNRERKNVTKLATKKLFLI